MVFSLGLRVAPWLVWQLLEWGPFCIIWWTFAATLPWWDGLVACQAPIQCLSCGRS
jgi:hypothetical protein